MPKRGSPLPALSDLNFELGLERKQAWLTNCEIKVEGQPVRIHGEMPLNEKFWNDVAKLRRPDFRNAAAQLQIEHAELAAFADLFPTILSPQGELTLDVRLVPGGELKGNAGDRQARSRPLPGVGPLRDIEIGLRFENRIVQLTKASARVGTSTVTATGQGDMRGTDWLRGVTPNFEFALYGTNVPLSRQPGSIIRSDLLLSVNKTNEQPPLISGVARLRDWYLSQRSH